MKIFSVFILLLLSITTHAQTAVIWNKSHSGDIASILEEPDNFGVIAPRPVIDSVIKVNETCIKVVGRRWETEEFTDTICDHWAFQSRGYAESTIRDHYGSEVVIVGFTNVAKPEGGTNQRWNMGRSNQNGMNVWLVIIFLSILAYTLIPVFKKK